MRHPQHAAVMFGASHNPAGDTGQKILGPNVAPIAAGIGPAGGLAKIKELYLAGTSHSARQRGRIWGCDLMRDYVDYSMSLAGVGRGGLRGQRLLQDYLFGAAGREMMLAFELAAADLEPLHYVADGDFPLGDPNPVKRNVVREGLERLRTGDFAWAPSSMATATGSTSMAEMAPTWPPAFCTRPCCP